MNNKKKILAIVLVIVILLLGGASIYVATQLSTKTAVAPTAPVSKPRADETTPTPIWVGSTDCTVEATAAAVITPTATPTATPTEEVKASLTGSKTAYKNVTANTPGSYSLVSEMTTVSKSQIFVYSIDLKNTSEVTATGVTIKDSLKGKNVTFMDAVTGCTWNTTDLELTCNASIKPGETKTFSYRVKSAEGIANGDVISNTAKVTYNGDSLSLTRDMTVSSVVSCNHTCTVDDECSTGLKCDTTTNKCRMAACLTEEDCVCVVTKAVTPTATKTITATPTKIATAAATPTILPETGILDLPGVAAFGGGLLLAVVGILLAL